MISKIKTWFNRKNETIDPNDVIQEDRILTGKTVKKVVKKEFEVDTFFCTIVEEVVE